MGDRLAGLNPGDCTLILAGLPRVSDVRRTVLDAMLAENRRRIGDALGEASRATT